MKRGLLASLHDSVPVLPFLVFSPSLIVIVASTSRRRIFLAGERIISFRPSGRGNHLWPVLINPLRDSRRLPRMIGYDYGVYIQPSPVLGLGYIDFFIPSQRDLLIRVIGYNATVRRLLGVATWIEEDRYPRTPRLISSTRTLVGLESISNDNCHRGGPDYGPRLSRKQLAHPLNTPSLCDL